MKCKFPVTFAETQSVGANHHSSELHRYNFKSDPRNVGAVVILSADESTYAGEGIFVFNIG